MKILIIQEKGRHEKNQLFRESLSLQRAFEKNGDYCTVWGLNHINYSSSNIHDLITSHDAVLLLENYDTTSWVPDLSSVKIPKFFWSIDSHCNLNAHIATVQKNKIDVVLCSIESDQEHFSALGSKTYYFPNAVDIDLVQPIFKANKLHDIGFCGSLFPERESLIKEIEQNINIKIQKDIWHIGNDMVSAINSYNIHLNRTIGKDINYRVFETLACKTTLLTNYTENIDKLFVDMQDIVIYHNIQDLVYKTNLLINDPTLARKIAESGYDKVIKNHSYQNRASEFIALFKELV
jgi:spore maturation protein CgeB